MKNLLQIDDLYGGYKDGVNILQGVNLTVDEGETVGIIGLNGSGKSTLGKAIMNMLPYRTGSIVFDGQNVESRSTHELAKLGIAIMHQGGAVFPNLSVWQNLQLACNSEFNIQNSKLAELIPLLQRPKKELMHIMADTLSGGQRHELALAMTLARKPKLVVLDEPSAGLSPKAVDEMYELLEKVRSSLGMTMLIIEQNIDKAVSFCDRCVKVDVGKVRNILNVEGYAQAIQRNLEGFINRYNQHDWDEIYKLHYDDAPWMNNSWKNAILKMVEDYMPENAKTLLDYGCGNGFVGHYFYEKGLHVDLSDISDVLIERIKEKYKDTDMQIYQTNTPDDLAGKKYDVIVAWGLFHHINPLDWEQFLVGFDHILNPDGILVIGGWDREDHVIIEDGKKARYAGHETWFINDLVDVIDYDRFCMKENFVQSFDIPPFTEKRMKRCFILKKHIDNK